MAAQNLVVIPCYNEKENIGLLIPEIFGLGEKFDILVVDDNSPDGTALEAERLAGLFPGVFLLRRQGKKGLAKAYLDGFRWALERDYELIFEMDADGSHRAEYLSKLLEKIKDCDLAVGSRYYQGRLSVINWDIRRVFLSLLGNFYARLVTGVPIGDATSGFKCFRRRVLEAIDLNRVLSEGYSFQIEMNWRAFKAGFKIGEIPIIFYERRFGISKMSAGIIREGLWILWKMKLKP
ncbi:MAG: polyprenol monophosphomannose synthase [bacterium]|nr:polyprenol monophosphomannose synthase [bacterium]